MDNSSRQDKEGWKEKPYILLLGEKDGGWCAKKNKSTTPSLTFPFTLILNKIGSFAEKADMHFGGSRIKHTC